MTVFSKLETVGKPIITYQCQCGVALANMKFVVGEDLSSVKQVSVAVALDSRFGFAIVDLQLCCSAVGESLPAVDSPLGVDPKN